MILYSDNNPYRQSLHIPTYNPYIPLNIIRHKSILSLQSTTHNLDGICRKVGITLNTNNIKLILLCTGSSLKCHCLVTCIELPQLSGFYCITYRNPLQCLLLSVSPRIIRSTSKDVIEAKTFPLKSKFYLTIMKKYLAVVLALKCFTFSDIKAV